MNTSQILIAFLALGASVSSIVAWRFAASSYGEMSHDSCLHLSAEGASHCRSFPPCSVFLASDHLKAKVMSLQSLSFNDFEFTSLEVTFLPSTLDGFAFAFDLSVVRLWFGYLTHMLLLRLANVVESFQSIQ